jgi:hypothetical protein
MYLGYLDVITMNTYKLYQRRETKGRQILVTFLGESSSRKTANSRHSALSTRDLV